MFENLREILPSALSLVQYMAAILGYIYVGLGISGFINASSSDPRNAGVLKPGVDVVMGGIFITNSYWIALLISTFTQDYESTSNILSYLQPNSASSPMVSMLRTIIALAQLLGVLSILRGLMMFRHASGAQQSNDNPVTSGLFFVVFGAAAANMNWTLRAASWLFSFPLPSYL